MIGSEPKTSLGRGDRLPDIRTPPPGPGSREVFSFLDRYETPGINTLVGGEGSLCWEQARGANVLDCDGNIFIDLTSGFGVASVGHRHPRIVAAIRKQAGQLIHGLADVHGHSLRAQLAERLAGLVPISSPKISFAISGSDAVEIALKTALLATGKPGILAFQPSYHGLTLGSLAATSRNDFRNPFREHLHSWVRRLPYGIALESIANCLRDDSNLGAMIVEPVVGREGVLFPPAGWLSGLAALCKRHGIVFIADEIFTGFCRTGSWFAVEHEAVRPDILCCGKALGGGMPIAAVIGRGSLMDSWAIGGEAIHTATFVANPVTCAAALASLEILEAKALDARALRLEKIVRRELEPLGKNPAVHDVRGRGLLWGVELRSAATAKRWADRLLAAGIIALAGGPDGRVLQVVPPLTITRAQLLAALSILRRSLDAEERTP